LKSFLKMHIGEMQLLKWTAASEATLFAESLTMR